MAPLNKHMPSEFGQQLARSVWAGLSDEPIQHPRSVFSALMAQRSRIWEAMEAAGSTRLGPLCTATQLHTTIYQAAFDPPRYNVSIGTSYSVLFVREQYSFRAPIKVEVTSDGGAFMAHVVTETSIGHVRDTDIASGDETISEA